ncbi:MAG: ABC transporter ATP-binding protein [Armatimonadota bacterium]
MLKVNNLVKYYRRHLAVDDVSFDINDGEIVGLLGPNGAGKTTVLRCITGIVQLTSGDVQIDDVQISKNEEEVKRRIAFVPEVPTPYEMLTVDEHLRFIAMTYQTVDDYEKRANELLDKFDLTQKRDHLVLSLSKGMKQKLAIACAFIHKSRVILLDEPLIGIDPKGVKELRELITDAKNNGTAVLISTHMLDTAQKLCDRIIILNKGTIVAEGTLSELNERAKMGLDASLEDIFLTLTQEEDTIETSSLS